MIRRCIPDDPSICRLIKQQDRARLAATLARQIAPSFLPKQISSSLIVAIEQQDGGWATHDDAPTLNKDGQPLDVSEASLPLALGCWKASVDLIESQDVHAALLVSLRVFSLSLQIASVIATSGPQAVAPPGKTLTAARARFELNQFQHREIERHESLRRTLNLPIDQPLQHGLATASKDPREIALIKHFRFLQAVDRLSLAACCAPSPVSVIELTQMDGRRPASLRLRRTDDATIAIHPWPFLRRQASVEVPSRTVDARFNDVATFRDALAASSIERVTQTFVQGG